MLENIQYSCRVVELIPGNIIVEQPQIVERFLQELYTNTPGLIPILGDLDFKENLKNKPHLTVTGNAATSEEDFLRGVEGVVKNLYNSKKKDGLLTLEEIQRALTPTKYHVQLVSTH